MVPKDRGVRHRSVAMGLDVAENPLIGNDAGFLNTIHSLPDFDVDIAAQVGEGEEGVFIDYLVWGVLQVYPHVLVVCH